MWIGDSIYFASDRDGELNIWADRLADGSEKRVTNHADFDIRRPSHGGTSIVYEIAGAIWILHTIDGRTRPIPIEIPTIVRETTPYRKNVNESITDVGTRRKGVAL